MALGKGKEGLGLQGVQAVSYRRIEAWLLKPWNAAFCLWTMTWAAILFFGTADYLRPEHADRLWQVGWGWTLIIAGLPVSPLTLPLLEYLAEHTDGFTSLNSFLVAWALTAAASFAFWLVLVPFVYRRLTASHSTIGL
jgi:hypothetical protein